MPVSGGILFPSSKGLVPHQTSLAGPARDLKIAAVPHSFRSSLRDWAGECTATRAGAGGRPDVAEAVVR